MSEARDLPERFPVGQELPEVNWLWRRLYSFGLTMACAGLVWLIVQRTSDPRTLRLIALCAVGIIVLTQMLYVGGATVYEVWQLVSAVRTKRIITQAEARTA